MTVASITDIPVNAGQATYIIPGDIAGSLTPAALTARYVAGLRASTGYRTEFVADDTETLIRGVRVAPNQAGGIQVTYLYHSKLLPLHHDYIADFNLSQTTQGRDVVLNVSCPTSMKDDVSGPNWAGYVKTEQAVADLRTMCTSTTLKFQQADAGELNVNYSDASVYANFARKLTSYVWDERDSTFKKDDIVKFKWFKVEDGGITRRVGITVFPYRNGSKVTYRWVNDVVVRANGTSNFDPAAAAHMQQLVASIAND